MKQPTIEECEARAPVEHEGRKGFATWYPQMGGYVGRCVVLYAPGNNACFDVYVWHDGEFPFDGEGDPAEQPTRLHHCMAEQFVAFGQEVLARRGERGIEFFYQVKPAR